MFRVDAWVLQQCLRDETLNIVDPEGKLIPITDEIIIDKNIRIRANKSGDIRLIITKDRIEKQQFNGSDWFTVETM